VPLRLRQGLCGAQLLRHLLEGLLRTRPLGLQRLRLLLVGLEGAAQLRALRIQGGVLVTQGLEVRGLLLAGGCQRAQVLLDPLPLGDDRCQGGLPLLDLGQRVRGLSSRLSLAVPGGLEVGACRVELLVPGRHEGAQLGDLVPEGRGG